MTFLQIIGGIFPPSFRIEEDASTGGGAPGDHGDPRLRSRPLEHGRSPILVPGTQLRPLETMELVRSANLMSYRLAPGVDRRVVPC